MAIKEETKLWLTQAEDDYQTAKAMLKAHRWGYTCFCSQQVLEKVFKATIVELADKRPPKTHDLLKLAEESTLGVSQDLFRKLAEISKHYFRVRYPDMHKGFYTNDKIAKETFNDMEEVYKWVLKKLNQ